MMVLGTYENEKEHRLHKEEKENKECKMGKFSSLSSLVISTQPCPFTSLLAHINYPAYLWSSHHRMSWLLACFCLLSYFLPAKFRLPIPCSPPPPPAGGAIYWVGYVPFRTLFPVAVFCSLLFHVMKVLYPLNLLSLVVEFRCCLFRVPTRSPRVIFCPLSIFH